MVTLKVRTLDGDITELPVESSDYVYSVAQRLAQLKKPSEKVFARLVKDGQPLAPGSQVGDCEGVVDAIWCKWMPPEMLGFRWLDFLQFVKPKFSSIG